MPLLLENFLTAALAVWVYVTLWFLIALWRKKNDVADIAWGLGFIFVAWLLFYLNGPAGELPIVINTLITLWGLRLVIHIAFRNWGRKEDFRYKQWREQWGRWFLIRTYGQVFLLQGLLLVLVASAVVVANTWGGFLNSVSFWVGARMWLLGFIFESLGDYQLLRFTRNPVNKGKIMLSGLWRYTRHPNYFGEVAQWWGIWITTLSLPFWWVGIISPLTITYLILKVSGIPMLEKKWEGNPEWEEYKKKTSPFFPWMPKKA